MNAITRRRILQTGIAVLAGAPVAKARITQPPIDEATKFGFAKAAYIWGFPLVMFGRYLDAYKEHNPLNQFLVQTALSTPSTPGGGPNVDTIYGYTWLDLRGGPQILHVPDVAGRYYSIQLIDMYSNCFAYVGSRATGTKAGAYAIVGPGWNGTLPHGVKPIPTPTNDVITFSRTFVMDDADTPAAVAIQNQYAFGGLADYPHAVRYPIAKQQVPLPPILHLATAGAGFYDELSSRLAADPPASRDSSNLKSFELFVGIGPGKFPSAEKATLEAAATTADKDIQAAQYGTLVNGWYVNYGITAFPTDPLVRASTVKYGPGAHIAEEALYFNADKGPDGQPLSGANQYVLRFPKGELPPVDAFWSLTAYSPTMSLIENPIRRYAIKGQMPGLKPGADGSLELYIQHGQPAQGAANWLPVPEGPFRLVMRTYQPKRDVLTQAYKLPAIAIAG